MSIVPNFVGGTRVESSSERTLPVTNPSTGEVIATVPLSSAAELSDAVHQALRYRLRPIFMSTMTSLFGMLPLLVVPGAGSDIYRGMAAAIVGAMSVSTLFTLLLLPSLLQLTAKPKKAEAIPEPAAAAR